jgi:hypothetical protein
MKEPKRRAYSIIAVVTVAVIVVTAITVITAFPAAKNHVVCDAGARLGNVTAWYPYSFVAGPFKGSESGALLVWENYTVGGRYINETTRIPTSAGSGDVAVGAATGGNWTVFSAANSTAAGPGASDPCSSRMIALLGPPNAAAAEAWSGATVATGLKVDTGLPSAFNASFRCSVINESSNCAVSSTFDLNFSRTEGQVDTCARATPVAMTVRGSELAVSIPFSWNGGSYSVPVGPSEQGGMTGWFNYTFPADSGIWQYESLPGIPDAGSGLVFSFSPCP